MLLVIASLLPSCSDGSIPLSYQVEVGQRLEHRLVLTADITRTLAGNERQQRVVASFRTSQEILGPAEPAAPPTPGVPLTPGTPGTETPGGEAPGAGTPGGETPAPGLPGIGLPGLGVPGAGTTTERTPTPQAPAPSPASTEAPADEPPVGELPEPAFPPTEAPVAQAQVTLVPESLEVDGQSVEVGPVQDFTVQLGPDGRVVAVGENVAGPGEVLEPVALERLLPRLRPVLPGRPVAPGDAWRSDTRFQDERGRFSVRASSRLAHLGVTDGYRAALVRTTYRSPVDREEMFSNAVAEVVGEDVGAQEAWFALDGFLVRASSDSVGTYDVTFRPPGGEPGVAPVQGSLVVRLHIDMQLVSAAMPSP